VGAFLRLLQGKERSSGGRSYPPQEPGRDGSLSNLTLTIRHSNRRKGNHPVAEFLKKQQETLKKILARAKAPLRAAGVKATRGALFESLKQTWLPVEQESGGRTKFKNGPGSGF
jgi:hypothetical protein